MKAPAKPRGFTDEISGEASCRSSSGPDDSPPMIESPTIDAPKDKFRPIPVGVSANLLVGKKMFTIGNPVTVMYDQETLCHIMSEIRPTLRERDEWRELHSHSYMTQLHQMNSIQLSFFTHLRTIMAPLTREDE
ncbi:TO102-1 protein [Artemisia annua]|uniref:TO102-1 protein n=1 Tax=Artemisia annua TaxID=35608 RepID=A0A2U1M288_ARTAN|nr:TO102-1 protein [Artemisia annua]